MCSGAHVCSAAKGADFLRRYSLYNCQIVSSKRLIGEGRSDSARDDGGNTELHNPRTIAGRETLSRLKGGCCAIWKVLKSLEEPGNGCATAVRVPWVLLLLTNDIAATSNSLGPPFLR